MKRYLALILALLFLLTACDVYFVGSTAVGETTASGDKPTNPDCHRDDDDNGICDLCYESVIVLIDFYTINDIHGKFKDSSAPQFPSS